MLIDVFVGIVGVLIDVVVVGDGGVSGSVVVVVFSGVNVSTSTRTSSRGSSRWRCHHGRYYVVC